MNALRASKLIDTIVPISRFNKGEANKIFSEVKTSGVHIVVKNNVPECVLVSPKEYQEMIEEIEDAKLYALAAERLKKSGKGHTQEQIMKKYGITQKDLDEIDVELE